LIGSGFRVQGSRLKSPKKLKGLDSIISSYFMTGSTGFIGFHQFLPEIDEDKKIS
jgi:hypothetical protein